MFAQEFLFTSMVLIIFVLCQETLIEDVWKDTDCE